ncbi:MAG TPA: MerR family transcriptional regulator [Xanthobacteraceae bacterium]|nr:MerR family transcriptional regulator [Xanthobacteraceae bacterium]
MDKSPDAFRTISEVADDLDLPQHVLRFWETRFPQIRPLKRGGGRRYYRPDDVELLRGIRHLLYSEGYTIRGVQRILKDQGLRFVQLVWLDTEQGGVELPPRSAEDDGEEAEPGERDGVLDLPPRPAEFAHAPAPLDPPPAIETAPAAMAARPEPAAEPWLAPGAIAQLQSALAELQQCRRILDAVAEADG